MECKICNETFSSSGGRELWKLSRHVNSGHKISMEDYILEYNHAGTRPTCKCGCGNYTAFYKGEFNEYFEDHKKYKILSKEDKKKISESLFKRFENNYDRLGLTKEKLIIYWEKYQTPIYNQQKISEISGHDFRTISRWWIKLGVASKNQLDAASRKHQFVYSNQGEKNGVYQKIEETTMDAIFKYLNFLKESKKITSYKKIIEMFELTVSDWVLKSRIEQYSANDYSDVFKKGLSSKSETQYVDMLSFIYGESNIKRSFKLGDKYYDACLYDKILIEYDGDFWHPEEGVEHPIFSAEQILLIKVNDNLKNDLARKHDMILFRIKESDSRNIQKLIELDEIIKDLLNNEKF